MSKTAKSLKQVEKSLAKLAKTAKEELPKEIRGSWNEAVAGVNTDAISKAGANLIENVGGNSKAAKRARASVENAVQAAQKSLSAPEKKSGKGGKFLLISLVIAAVAAVVISQKKN
ncbi:MULTISPECIES: hypothetical protein [Glutamicibacter]|uniref:DUF3618 domain-containing protein n=1 Tax=Glutamicibacter nicotianae TaxID=37929 RepID=A0ABQ0RGB8_GLUNI|nr:MULTISPECIES: hypothetical protein [Glutamicibacter]KWR72619.1 hypothetical protein RN04_07280 [Arthrobacter sp. W1]RWZ79772.1 hypothetical protein EKH49_15655 [Glutamicibacter sp. HZAU]UTM47154.1 hypothetical protein XH9_16750 [Glutamicibacter mysorens]GEC10858.1 hypothetical protein ANI01nite_00610 [Glutamicibacter nicotianae]